MSKLFKGFNFPPKVDPPLAEKLIEILKNGGIGIVPTDTIYGIVGSALNKKTVERIYKLRKRNLKKPMIVLIGGLSDLKLFGIKLNLKTRKILSKIWPNKISVILPCPAKASREGGPCEGNKFSYLHRGTEKLAFRFPKNKKLVSFLKKTGPLVAPSANWEGYSPAENIKQAKEYFGGKIDFYVDVGIKKSLPSTLIEIKNGKLMLLRSGVVRVGGFA